jgi:hypothetical protein
MMNLYNSHNSCIHKCISSKHILSIIKLIIWHNKIIIGLKVKYDIFMNSLQSNNIEYIQYIINAVTI